MFLKFCSLLNMQPSEYIFIYRIQVHLAEMNLLCCVTSVIDFSVANSFKIKGLFSCVLIVMYLVMTRAMIFVFSSNFVHKSFPINYLTYRHDTFK